MPVYAPQEWPLEICKVKEAWALPLPAHGKGKAKGEGITIFHPDTGWTAHPELLKGGRYLFNSPFSKNFLKKTPDNHSEDTLDSSLPFVLHPSHGTSTASLMLSEEGFPNPPLPLPQIFPDYTPAHSEFVTGIAPAVKVIPCRVANTVLLGFGNIDIINKTNNNFFALTLAIYHGVSLPFSESVGVISISLGGSDVPYLSDALKFARQWGLITIAAAGQFMGNGLGSEPTFPGRSPHVICVAGCNKSLEKPSEGFYGKAVTITAPGWGVTVAQTIKEAFINTRFIINNSAGTSHSTALTAGACAVWLAFHNRDLLIQKYGRPFLLDVFRYVLKKTVHTPNGWDSENRGKGVLNVEELLKFQLPPVEVIEAEAKANKWTEDQWGDRANWGRI